MIASSRVVIVLTGMLTTAVVPAGGAQAPAVPPGAPAPGATDPTRLPSRPATPGGVPSLGVPPRDASARRPPETGTAVVRGRVIALDTGLPVRRARVSLFGAGQPRVSTTDADGEFLFEGLPASRYQLRASKARYVDTVHGARRPGGPGRPLEVADGQTLEGLTLALPPAAVIAGRVVDDAGEGVPGATVMAMRYRTVNGERQLVSAGQKRTTDDTGAFRLYGLPPGTYYVSALADEFPRFSHEVPESTGFAPTYFPGTPVEGEAQPIEVAAGTEFLADVQLVTARLTTVSGVVVGPAGTPATGGHLMLSGAGGRVLSGGFGGPIGPDGTFTLSRIPPGEYTIVARATFTAPSMYEQGPTDDQARVASVTVVANGEPIRGLRLVVQDPIRIPVHVTFEEAAVAKPERVMVSAMAVPGMFGDTARLRDGRLAFELVPGTYRFSAGAFSAAPWFVKRLAYRGQAFDEEEDLTVTAEPGGRIDVVFAASAARAAGGVTDASGQPVTDALVFVVPADLEVLRRSLHRHVRTVRPDAHGRFRVEPLPPGDYLATAIGDTSIEDPYDLDFLASIRRAGTPFTVQEGGAATLSLTLATLP